MKHFLSKITRLVPFLLFFLIFNNSVFSQSYWSPTFAWTVYVGSPQDDFDFHLYPNTVNLSTYPNFNTSEGDYITITYYVKRWEFNKWMGITSASQTFTNGVNDVFTISNFIYSGWLKSSGDTPSCTYYGVSYLVIAQLTAIMDNGTNIQTVSTININGSFTAGDGNYFVYPGCNCPYGPCDEEKSNSSEILPNKEYELSDNYPNPFNPVTIIEYQIPTDGFVNLTIYNMLGEKVTNLVNEYQNSGKYTIHFDGQNLPSGMYLYNISVNGFNKTMKMILAK